MATSLSASAVSCQFSNALCLRGSPAVPSTSYGVQPRIGATGRRSSKCSVTAQAQKQGGGGRGRREEERDEVSDLENALGIENKTVRNASPNKKGPQRRPMSVLDALEEQMRVNEGNAPPESLFMQNLRRVGDWLVDKTENTGGQDGVVMFAFAVFPFWFLALLVTSGAITLPFDLPFLHH